MKKSGIIVIAVLIGTILYEIIDPAIEPNWLRLVIELVILAIFGFGGLAIAKSTDNEKATQSPSE